ncbi:MAG: methionine gamma-lyase family protein [Peptoniphilus sp.]|nr:methionine gamma-lyase family protein [Peptoniphilus sp.]MDD7362998.1 methionine gamma-lyase family protein [Bacillota bacterium]MDY6044238.1 methionine gamma-lyase family protein [Peptoniphilus sp.]
MNREDLIEIERELSDPFRELDRIALINQEKVLKALQEVRLASTDFNWTTGYGYGDVGREKVEKVYAQVFKTEDALVRPNIVSGTHAIALPLKALTSKGSTIFSVTGAPYDTLHKVLGTSGDAPGNLRERGVKYRELPLKDDKMIDFDHIAESITPDVDLVIMQRSTGYSDRRAFTVDELARAVREVKKVYDGTIFLDNCYGEFTEVMEPSEVGFDVMAGSLIKNPGGGLSLTGGYIVGTEAVIERVASELTAPGIGKECGLTFGQSRNTLMGLFLAPHRVNQCIKGALLFAKTFERLGFDCIPASDDPRSDIVQSIALQEPEHLVNFCRAVQASSPVDSHVTPYPWDMPGYEDQVIMAAGGFIEGSSIELSADGPMRDPYRVYFQGGLTYEHIKLTLLHVLREMGLLEE